MRYESCVTSLSWIPSEAVVGGTRLPFDAGVAHYDQPPPDVLGDLDELREADRFRFANRTRGLDRGRQVGLDQQRRLPGRRPDREHHGPCRRPQPRLPGGRPARHPAQARAAARAGCASRRPPAAAPGMPAPRRVRRAPFVQWQAPLAWTTLSLTMHADGRAEGALSGASRFPRHWVYDNEGHLAPSPGSSTSRTGTASPSASTRPWGDQESEALVTVVESALERSLSAQLMRGAAKPRIKKVKAGTTLVRQGEAGSEVYLVLDGVLRVEVDGERLAEYGPGALLGERAHLEGGARTSSLVAVTACRVASVPAEALDRSALEELSTGHRREDAGGGLSGCAPTSWGCEARRPRPGESFVRYGGHTSCVAIAHDDSRCTDTDPRCRHRDPTRRARCSGGEAFAGTILLTHLHWDHVHGLPFFQAADREDARVELFLPEQPDGAGAGRRARPGRCRLRTFPIGPTSSGGKWSFATLSAGADRGRRLQPRGKGDPAQGGTHLRLPRERRDLGASPTCPTTARAS